MYVAYWFLAESPAVDSELSKLEQLLALANGNPVMGWGLAGFAVLAMATAAIASWTGNLGTILDFIKKYILRNQTELTEEQSQKLLKQLNAIALKEVTERLNKSLHHRIPLDVRREEQQQRVGQRDRPTLPNEPESVGLISQLFKSLIISRTLCNKAISGCTRSLCNCRNAKIRLYQRLKGDGV